VVRAESIESSTSKWKHFGQFIVRNKYGFVGAFVSATGVAVAVWLGVLSSSVEHPPSTSDIVILLAGSTTLQIVAGITFGRVGHVDVEKAKSAVRRLVSIGKSSAELREQMISALIKGSPDLLHDAVVRGDEGLKLITQNIADSVEDWIDVHSSALTKLLAEAEDRRRRIGGN